MSKMEKTDFEAENSTPNPQGTWRILKNVVVISLAFMVHFMAYSGAANLQSSINAKAGLGTASLAAVYAGLIFSNIFLPVAVIKWLGTKWTLAVSFLTYMPYIAAQLQPTFWTLIPAGLLVGLGGGPLWCAKCTYLSVPRAQLHPTFWTLIPAGLLVGLGGGPLWCAKCTYLSVVSEAHSKISGISPEALLVRFLGLFFMIFQMNQVWGNLISSLVLTSGDNAAAVTSLNASQIPELCGANFLPADDAGEALQAQPPEKIQMIAGIYLACMAGAAIIVAVGVDSMKRYESGKKPGADSGLALLATTLKLLVEPNQLLLVTVNVFVGYQQAFFGADFTAAFVSCAVGTGTVGFVMMTYGLADAIGCVVSGYIAKMTGRIPLLCLATLVHTGLFAFVLAWKPQANSELTLYIIAVVWGISDSVWIVQINAYYGILFPGREEAAFSNFRLWESVGYIIAYVLSPYLRTSSKTYLMVAMMATGMVCYAAVEVRDRKAKRILEEKRMEKGCDNEAFQNVEHF